MESCAVSLAFSVIFIIVPFFGISNGMETNEDADDYTGGQEPRPYLVFVPVSPQVIDYEPLSTRDLEKGQDVSSYKVIYSPRLGREPKDAGIVGTATSRSPPFSPRPGRRGPFSPRLGRFLHRRLVFSNY